MKLCYKGKAQRKYLSLLSIKISVVEDLQSGLTGNDVTKINRTGGAESFNKLK